MASTTITKFAHLQIPLEDVLKATNNFHDDNFIGSGGFGPAYKGQLQQSGNLINIVALRLTPAKEKNKDVRFWTEISMLSDLKHTNLVSIVGFCDENDEKIIITTYAAKGSLKEHLNNMNLTWTHRLKISVGVARALSYLHYGDKRGYGVIHLNINSSTILLDDNWEAKLSGFKVSIKQSLNRMDRVILSEPIGTIGYMDPEIEKTKGVTHKSDIYSLGVVLFKILCGRRAYTKAKYHYENKTLQDIIHIDLRNQMSPQSLAIYSKAAYSCLKERAHRPNTNNIVEELEKALELQLGRENLIKKLEHLKICLSDVKLATNNFSETYIVGSRDGFTLYRAELDHFDKENHLSVEGKNKDDYPKGHNTVVIKRYTSTHDLYGEEHFFKEIEMLRSVKHPNIVTLLGFCVEGYEMILVTENISNGYLGDYLGNATDMNVFTWEKRLQICIDVAHALKYLHYEIRDQKIIINCNIKSDNIGLDENYRAKISDFGLSVLLPPNQEDEALYPNIISGKNSYSDPKFEKTSTSKTESDVYSFGLLLFEILCGRVANDPIYLKEGDQGLAAVARRCYRTGTLKELIDPIIKEETSENNFVLNRGSNNDPLHTFIEIANRCVKETLDQRPTMKVVVKELEKALAFQKNSKDNPIISLEDIKIATQNFCSVNCIGRGGFGRVYKGELQSGDGFKTIVAKRLDTMFGQGEQQFLSELQVLWEYKHENVIGLVGYCDELDEKIIVYEYASRGSLDRYLSDASLTWMKRLNICIDIASALDFIHGGVRKQAKVIHRNVKSANILLNHDWKGKLADFGLSLISPLIQETDYVIDHACGTIGYLDPLYKKSGFLTIKSDIYSFGVVLFEMLCGRSTFEIYKHEGYYLPDFIKNKFEEGKHEEVVFKQIREQIVPKSLTTFQRIAYRCLHIEREERPTTKEVLRELKKAMGFQTYVTHRPIARLEIQRKEIKRKLAHLQIRLDDIVYATNNFSDHNLIKEGEFGKDYKGQMMRFGQLIDICARRLTCKYGHGDIEFQTEISMLSNLKHENIISFIGFCDEYGQKIVVYEHAIHGSLDQYLSDPNFTWFRRLKICLGVAQGLSYMHYDVIHCDINSSKIFLDKDWEPKIVGFELSTKYPQSWRHRLLFSSSFDNKNVTPKYDVYSFGALLFEVLYGMKPVKTEHGVKFEPDDIINPTLRKQMNKQSLTDFIKITYMCLNEHPAQRPTMGLIVKQLEEVLELQSKHENLEHTTAADEGTSSNIMKMQWMEIPLRKIREATNDFHQAHFVGSGGFGSVYKAELDVVEIQNLSSIAHECPKLTRKTVAIKCIKNRQDEASKQGFLTEIELLTRCKHPNIISLLGFCMEAHDIILVYEYATKGSLSDYLGDKSDYIGSTRKNVNLTWAKRIQICLDIAHGINYLHTNMEGKPTIIHRDIKSENILLDENLNAKVADFGLSKFHFASQQASTIQTKHIAGTEVYMDPEYLTSFKYKKASDIYSFGVVLSEMISGRLAYDQIYTRESDMGLAPIARRHFSVGTLKEMIDPKMIEEDDEDIVTLNRGPNEESFEAFSKIAYQCLAETQAKRPTMEVVMKELHTALNLQGETIVLSRFRLNDILVATKNFSDVYCIGLHEYGKVYKAELDDFKDKSLLASKEKTGNEWPKTRITVAIKRTSNGVDVKQRFLLEVEMRTSYKHPNIVSLIGFCDEGDDDIFLVYEHASNESLDDYLKNVDNKDNFTWAQRLHMCLGIARGLNHLHTKMDAQERIIHGDIRSANILLGENLEPKIAYFGISNFHLENQEASTLTSTKVYWDPEFERTRTMKIESDIFSFGVILLELFCGRLAYDSIFIDENDKGLAAIARSRINDGEIRKLLDPKLIKEVIDDDISTSIRGPNHDSLDMFSKIASLCLEEAQAKRPTMETVVKELEIALNFQVSQSVKDA